MVRLTLLLGKQEFEDDRIAFDKWPALKPQVPLGALPVAEIDGKQVSQTMALVRYFGKQSGLYPQDAWKSLMVDQVIETVLDMQSAIFNAKGADKDAIRDAREKMLVTSVPRYWGGAEKLLEDLSDGPFVLGDEVSIADVCITALFLLLKVEFLEFIPIDALSGYPRLDQVFASVLALPEVKEWYTNNPVANLTV